MRLAADYHTHTIHSHGKGTVLDNIKAAAKKGLLEIAIADHGPANLFGIGTKGTTSFKQIRKELDAALEVVPEVRGLLSVEANILSADGRLDVTPSDLKLMDIVQAGIHILVNPKNLQDALDMTIPNILGRYSRRVKKAMRDRNTKAVVEAVHRYPIDILTHPGLRIDIDTEEIAYHCARTNTFMEINTSHNHITPEYIRIAKAQGVRFVIGSDAHSPERVGDFTKGIELAKKAGLTPEDIRNAVTKKGYVPWRTNS